MKVETKSKLMKYGKRALFGLGLVAFFLLGVGVGACSARKAVGSSAVDDAPSMAQPKRVAPPLSPSEFPTLDTGDDNLLLGAYGGYAYYSFPEGNLFKIQRDQNQFYNCFLLRDLPTGLYRLSVSNLVSWSGDYGLVADSVCNSLLSVINGVASNFVTDYDSRFGNFYDFQSSSYFVVSNELDNILLRAYSPAEIKLTLVNAENIPASHDITFPDNYNPLAGFGTASDGLIGQLGGSTSSPFHLDLYFRSGGQIYKGIDFYFLPMQGMEYVSSLNSSGTPSVFTGSGFVYASMINYIAYDGSTFLAWRAIFGTKVDGTLYLRNFGEWASKQYQTINVFDYTPVFGLSGVAPNLDQIGILELRTASGVPTPIIGGDSNADVFSLLSTGFSSVAVLLNIQILPFLTLGTLIFVPLVVMVIFAILKVLNK